MTQYDRIKSGKATEKQIADEITAAFAAKETYRRLPGHVLVEEFLVPYYPTELSDLARRAKIPFRRLQKLIHGQDRIDQDMAAKLANVFGNETNFWLDLQARYERGEKL